MSGHPRTTEVSADAARLWLVPALVLALTLGLTLFAWHRSRASEDAREAERFEEELMQAQVTINRATAGYINSLRTVQAYLHTQREFFPNAWRTLVRGMEWKKRFPALLDFGVAASEEDGVLRVVFAESRAEHGWHQPGADFAENERYVRVTRAAAQQHSPQATEIFELAPGQRGVVLFIPLWQDGLPFRNDGTSAAVRGFVFASMDPAAFYSEWIETLPHQPLNLELVGSHPMNQPPLVVGRGQAFERVITLPGVGQPWDVRCTRGPGFADVAAHRGSTALLGGGLGVSALSFGLALMQARRRREVETRVEERTAELRRAEEELRAALAQERALHEMKTRFVHLISHEFRTPLGVILTSAEMMERYAARLQDEERTTYLHDISAATRHMTGLIEQVLLHGRSEAGRFDRKPLAIGLSALAAEWAAQTRAAYPHIDGITVRVENCDAPAHGDPTLLRAIFTNLLGNAAKYSPPGAGVAFTITREYGDAVFSVRDHGPGIPVDDQARLFTPFHRAANVTHVPGTGLGLVIVKHCVDTHGGSIALHSTPQGTEATVRLPLFSAT